MEKPNRKRVVKCRQRAGGVVLVGRDELYARIELLGTMLMVVSTVSAKLNVTNNGRRVDDADQVVDPHFGGDERQDTFVRYLSDRGLFDPAFLKLGTYSPRTGYDLFRELMSQADKPSAIMIANRAVQQSMRRRMCPQCHPN